MCTLYYRYISNYANARKPYESLNILSIMKKMVKLSTIWILKKRKKCLSLQNYSNQKSQRKMMSQRLCSTNNIFPLSNQATRRKPWRRTGVKLVNKWIKEHKFYRSTSNTIKTNKLLPQSLDAFAFTLFNFFFGFWCRMLWLRLRSVMQW